MPRNQIQRVLSALIAQRRRTHPIEVQYPRPDAQMRVELPASAFRVHRPEEA